MVLFFVILITRQAPGDGGGETITGPAYHIRTIKTVDICQGVG